MGPTARRVVKWIVWTVGGVLAAAFVFVLVVLWAVIWHGANLPTHGDPQAWAAEVGMLIGGVSLVVTVILAGATIAYVILTGRLARSSDEAASAAVRAVEAAEAQRLVLEAQLGVDREALEHTRAALDHELQASDEARRLARRSADEAARTRLVSTTPVVEVSTWGGEFRRADGTAIRRLDRDELEGLALTVIVGLVLKNHGPGPAVVAPLRALAPDGTEGRWLDNRALVVAQPGQDIINWKWTASGRDLLAREHISVELTLRSHALADTGVVDVHRWRGIVMCVEDDGGRFTDRTVRVVTHDPLAQQQRRWPDELERLGDVVPSARP